MAAFVLCRRDISDFGEPVKYCARAIERPNKLNWCEPCASRLPFWPQEEKKACGALSLDERKCHLPQGHAPPHLARCGTCGVHSWPQQERCGDHEEALRMDAVISEKLEAAHG